MSVFLHASDGRFHAGRVPEFEGAEFPVEAEVHGAVNLHHGVGNLGNAICGIRPQVGQRRPKKSACFVGLLRSAAIEAEQHSNARSCVLDVFRHLERREFGLLLRIVLQRFPVERHALVLFAFAALDLLIEAALGFVAQPLAFQHVAKESGNLQFALVAHVLRHVRDHVPEDVEPHQINRPERGRARPADGLTGERVDLFDAQVHFLHEPYHVEHGKCTDAIADEVGRIFRQHDALAQLRVAEVRDGLDQRGVRFWGWDQFHQPHIARRIKKVGAEPRAPEVFGKSGGDLRHRKSAGVGGDDGARLADGLHLLQQRALDFEVLDDSLDDPVHLGQTLQIVVEISHGDQPRKRRFEKRRRL